MGGIPHHDADGRREGDTDNDGRQPQRHAQLFLPDAEMQMLELRFFEKKSFAEVGEIIGITENNAKVRTYRILDKLKINFKKAGG